jgi:hypothetical protein
VHCWESTRTPTPRKRGTRNSGRMSPGSGRPSYLRFALPRIAVDSQRPYEGGSRPAASRPPRYADLMRCASPARPPRAPCTGRGSHRVEPPLP